MSNPILDPAAAKAALRKEAARRRAALAADDPDAAERLAAQADIILGLANAMGEENPVLAAYFPIRSELSPLPLVERMARAGLQTAMPVTPEPGLPLAFHGWAPGDGLAEGPYNTRQPLSTAPQIVPTVILAPMLAFDEDGWRLGYGGGFYDRTLAALRDAGRRVLAIGIAHDGQLVDRVPTGPFDIRLDGVLTPSGFRPAASGSRGAGEV